MAGISPIAWLSIGVLISIVSVWLGGKLFIFLYAGLFFIVVGAFKALTWYITRDKESPAERAATERQVPQTVHSQYTRCGRCGLLTYASANYCHRCGNAIQARPLQEFDPLRHLQQVRK